MDSGSDMIETDIESTAPEVQAISVALSFNNRTGGAWDDRELINAYDAAMDEFHLHHPGPGSWLDKVTAAQKKGQPLHGAKATSSAWYSASAPAVPASAPTQPEPAAKKRKTQGSGTTTGLSSSGAGPSIVNPYATTQTTVRRNGTSRKSPAYAPPSPPAEGEDGAVEEEEGGGYDNYAAEWYDQSYDLAGPRQMALQGGDGRGEFEQHAQGGGEYGYGGFSEYGPPAFAPQPTHMVNPMEAMGYAMSAQYWAGYWMGVAQAKSKSNTGVNQAYPAAVERDVGQEAEAEEVGQDEDRESAAQSAPSNVFVTKKHFTKPGGPFFKR